MSNPKDDKHNFTVDFIRIISILAVVLIHTSTRILEYFQGDLNHHLLTFYLNQFSRFAVPLFFMISAFVLELNFSYPFNYWTYLKRRFRRLFIPYVFWSAIYYYLVYLKHSKNILSVLLTGDASYQLYFIPTLFIFYLSFPLFHYIYNYFISQKIMIVLAGLQVLLLALDYYGHAIHLPYPLSVFLFNFYIFILGIYAFHHQDKLLNFTQKYKQVIIITTIILSFIIAFEALFFYHLTGNYLFYYSQWRPSILVYSILIFILLFTFFHHLKLSFSFINNLTKKIFFIFFIHVLILELIWKYFPHQILSFPLVLFFLVTIFSYLAAFIFSKDPYLSKVTG